MQMEYNVIDQVASPAFEQATRAGVAVIARVPLERGFLSGRFDVSHQFEDEDNRRRNLTTETMQKSVDKLELVKREAKSLTISPAALAVRFACLTNTSALSFQVFALSTRRGTMPPRASRCQTTSCSDC